MKIVVFSINPIFRNKVTGGASKHLYYITQFLGNQGHQVEIICPQTEDLKLSYQVNHNVKVFPELPFKLPFPQPYAVSPPTLSLIIDRINKRLQNADRFYIHDGEWLIPDIYHQIPTVASFRDNIYPESILGTFIGKPDDIISVSDYSAAVIEHTAGLFFPQLHRRLHTVINGIDFDFFKPVDSSGIAKRLGINPDEDFVILHPHRPEEGKGLAETIRVVHRLVHKHRINNLKALIPEWIGSMMSNLDSSYYNAMMRLMQDLEVDKNFIFVPWLPVEQMPSLYSLGDVTLCLGNIVEAFGNVAYESLACGTPSIVSRVGVHRSLLGDDLIDKVDYGDIDDVVQKILKMINSPNWNHHKVLAVLKDKMAIEKQVKSYGEIIINSIKREPLRFKPLNHDKDTKYSLAPWCYFKGDLIYHDYEGGFTRAERLKKLLEKSKWFSRKDAEEMDISGEIWQHWLDKTWIVPSLEK